MNLPAIANADAIVNLTTFLLGLAGAALFGAVAAAVQARRGYTGHNFRFTMTELIVRSVVALLAVIAFSVLAKLPLDDGSITLIAVVLAVLSMIFAFVTYARLTFRLFFHALKSV
ncbi:hypothetical protein [Poseidonocella sp. HB161398]|uniref:hypothetical protein n=1 Tax=Poseidonocella sp. HB161398 TaxID=2320855 RepID=UPI001109E34D|nr:hypothetical protein [Poseidonocella sp. HB161398]